MKLTTKLKNRENRIAMFLSPLFFFRKTTDTEMFTMFPGLVSIGINLVVRL